MTERLSQEILKQISTDPNCGTEAFAIAAVALRNNLSIEEARDAMLDEYEQSRSFDPEVDKKIQLLNGGYNKLVIFLAELNS